MAKKKQTIEINKTKYTLQDLDIRSKITLQQMSVDVTSGALNMVDSIEFVLKYVVVAPQGLKMEDFKYDELMALYKHAQAFLELSGDKGVTVNILEE